MVQLDWSSVNLDRSGREPLADQLVAAIEARIATGLLSSGSRLPTTRELSGLLAVNRGTVQSAYRALAGRGLVATRVGSGTVVASIGGSPAARPFDPDALLSRRAADGAAAEAPPPLAEPVIADFSRLTPDERFFPLEEFTRVLSETWNRRPELWQYAPPLGLQSLRIEIARRLADHGVHRVPDEVLITSGAQQALDLLFRTFTDPGDLVGLESPTYSGALALTRFSGVDVAELPMTPEGPDVSALLGRRAKLVYVMPERQNPTGVTMTEDRRKRLLEAVAGSGALLVEDGYEEPESGLEPLAARMPERTVWLGTLSKDLVPGFRIGWLAGPRSVIDPVARIKKTADFQTPLPLQAAVSAFLRAGADRTARRRRALEVETRRIQAARALKIHLPQLSWWGGEVGNPLFWIHLPPGVSGRRVAEAAALRGVGVASGAEFDPRGRDIASLRLSVTRVDKRDIERGIAILADAVRGVEAASAAHSAPVV
jgi:DNA-binding transcriptional MocR family regulator